MFASNQEEENVYPEYLQAGIYDVMTTTNPQTRLMTYVWTNWTEASNWLISNDLQQAEGAAIIKEKLLLKTQESSTSSCIVK